MQNNLIKEIFFLYMNQKYEINMQNNMIKEIFFFYESILLRYYYTFWL
jgi:hypothetical protein